MACINPNTPEFKAALERTGGNPLLAEIEIDKGLEIKPGVQELFDSNNSLFGLNIQNQKQLEFHINTLNVVGQFLENAGVEQRLIPEFLSQDGSVIEGALAAANFIEGTVDIINDVEKRPSAWNKLPEEAAHWWYRLLDTNSELKDALLTSALTDRKEEELRNSLYGNIYDGPKVIGKLALDDNGRVISKPALSPVREEAIGQLIAEAIKRIETKNANASDYSFFKRFLKWINSIIDAFKNTTQDPFEVAAMKILSSDMSDLMTWEEYRKLNNIVNFADVLTEQSVAPIDYSLIEDIGFIGSTFMTDENGDATSGYRFHFKDSDWIQKYGDNSPSFYTQQELDNWVSANIKEYGERQKQILQEVKDNQLFFDRLLNKSFRKKSKFLPKTLRKYFQIIDAQNLNQLKNWNISSELQQITKKLSEQERNQIIETNGYTNISPTLKVLPDLLQKYKKNSIILSESIKIDGGKKQELSILNGIKEMIKLENPSLKSITAEEFVAEAHNWLETNYLLGFANEQSYLSYKVDQTFIHVKDRQSNEDVDLTNMTNEQIQALPYEERQRMATILGLTKQNPDVYHNKVSIRFNDRSHLKSGHFNLSTGGSPSAWGNLTYFYTGKNKWKDAVLLHEIQNDNIEHLREFKNEKINLETSLGRYLQQLNFDLIDNITQIESGDKKIQKNYISANSQDNHFQLRYQLDRLINLPLEQGLTELKQSLDEKIELYKSDGSLINKPEKAKENVDKAYSQRRKFTDFQKRGGIKSLLTKEELDLLKHLLQSINKEGVEQTVEPDFDENGHITMISEGGLAQKKQEFNVKSGNILSSINSKFKKMYGEDAPIISLNSPAKPLPKSQRRNQIVHPGTTREMRIGNASQDLNESVNFLLVFSEQQILKQLSKNIEERKKDYLRARNATMAYNFNISLAKITQEQYNNLIENYKYNHDLLSRLVDEQSQKDMSLFSNNMPSEIKNSIMLAESTKFDILKQKALDKKVELEKNYGKIEDEVKQTLEIEMNYFTPLVHHLIQKHINQYGKEIPMYFSGYNITKLTQGNDRTALIYAGKDEVTIVNKQDFDFKGKNYIFSSSDKKIIPRTFYIGLKGYSDVTGHNTGFEYFVDENNERKNLTKQEYNKAKEEYEKAYQQATERKAKEIKFQAGIQIRIIDTKIESVGDLKKLSDKELDEGIKKLNEFKKQSKQNLDRVVNTIMNISNSEPIETGAIYNAMTQISGVKLIWQNEIEGLQNNPGGYLVDLSGYNYNTPILYGLENQKKESLKSTVKEKAIQESLQSEEKSSENIDNKIKKFLTSIGVNIKLVENLTDHNGNKISGIAVADMLNKIIQVVENKSDVTTLPEEATHFFVEMLGEKNLLYKQMFDSITSYKIYQETVEKYRNDKLYKNADGTLNINKLKKEAIAKLIVKYIIKNETGDESVSKINSAKSWWSKLLDWIKNVFKQTPNNPFEEVAQKIINNDISDLNLDVESNESYLQLEAQSGIEKVLKDQKVLKLDDGVDSKTGVKKHVYTENGNDIIDKNGKPRSVTNNVVDPWYKNKFPTDSRTDVKKTIDEFLAEKGTDIHADLESILRRFVDENGDLKAIPGPITSIKTNDVVYAKLEQYILSLLNEFKGKPGTKFLAEIRIYSRKRNLPGTIDLLIMEPDGVTHIYDWKSQQINKGETELKWFKPEAYRIQLGEYKKILMEEYGIFKFGKIRAIPIATKYLISNVKGTLTPVALQDIEMEYDINSIPKDKDYLLPVVMLDESTGDPKIDSLIAKLNAAYEKISIGDVKNSEKVFKHEELNILKKAINDLHIRKDMTVFIENGLYEINKYLKKIQDGTFDLKDAKDSLVILNVYAEGSVFLEKLFVDIKAQLKTETNPDVRQYLENLQEGFLKMSQNAKALLIDIKGIHGEKKPSGIIAKLVDEFAKKEGITTILNPEVQMDFAKRTFRSLTTLGTAAMDTFAKILRRAQSHRNIKIIDLNKNLQSLKKDLMEWGKLKGLTGNEIFNPILEIDSKGNWNGDFVKMYSPEYFKLREEALKNEDAKWFKENTDFDDVAYEKDLQTFKDNVEERYPEKDEKTEYRKKNLIDRWIEKHSKDSKVAYFNKKNFYVKPKDKWQSEKYKLIYAKDSSGKYINEPLKKTYEFFQKLIKESSEIGMLDRYSSRFIPSVYQNAVTNIIGSSFKNIYDIQSTFESLVVDVENGFGNIDPLTGVLKKQMKVYFKKDLGVEKEDGSIDYSHKSKDLFSVFSIWGQQLYNYEAMDSIRDKSDVLLELEKSKSRLKTNMWGMLKNTKETIAENRINSGILEDYINYYIYGEIKGSDVDKAIPIKGKNYSLTKATQKVIKAATFKTLALNVLSGTATFVGGTGNALFQASKRLIFTEKDWVKGVADFTSNNEVTRSGIDFFDLGLDDREKHDVRNLSTSWKKKNLKWDHLLFMQHYGDKWATYPIAATMLRTYMFDGKDIVSIRDYVKGQNDYENFYKLPENERSKVQKKIDKEIDELQKTKSLKAEGKVINGEFTIPGLDKTSDAAINFRAKVQKTLKGIIGNATRDDMTTLRMGLIGQVLMQYRSWMPQMMAERFGDMTHDVDLETWQYGKTRLFLKHIVNGRVLPLLKEMIFGFGNNTIEEARKRHKEFIIRLLDEGKISNADEFMTESEFIDMYIGSVRSMMRELIILTTFMLLLFWGMGDDDDDEDVSGFKKYAKKALQKYQNEFSFYYSPTEFTKMLKNPIPIVGVGEDFERFLTQGIGQVYNFAASDEEGMDKNKPAKYFFKLLPITKEGLNFYALYDDEFRKEWAIK